MKSQFNRAGCDTGMVAKLIYPPGAGGGGGSQLVGTLEADLRSSSLVPVTSFTAQGTRCVAFLCLQVSVFCVCCGGTQEAVCSDH